MKEAFDPPSFVAATPATENATSIFTRKNIWSDAAAEGDDDSSRWPWDSMKSEEDADFLSHANRALSFLGYEAESLECTYATDIRSDVYPKEAMSPRSEYDRQQPYLPLSSYSWDSSSSLEAMPGNPDASGNVMAKMGTKSNIFGPRHDYLTSCPTTGSHMRRPYPEAAKVDCSSDCHSEHHYKGPDRFTAFTNCNGQSVECRCEIVDMPRGGCCVDETTSFSSHWCFENGGWGSSLPRGLTYGDEIPSLSSRRCNGSGALSRSSQWHYGADISSLSSRQGYGDEIPSLSNQKFNGISRSNQWNYSAEIPSLSSIQSYRDEIPSLSTQKSNGISYPRQWQQYGADIPSFSSRQSYGEDVPTMSHHWCCRDKVPLISGQRRHGAELRLLSSYQQGPFRGNRHPRDNFAHGLVSNQQAKMTATRHTGTRPRVSDRVVNSTNQYRSSRRDNPPRNSEEDIRDQVCGPRADSLHEARLSYFETDDLKSMVCTSFSLQ